MGKKYASIHIYDTEQTTSLAVIKDFYNEDKSIEGVRKNAFKIFKNNETKHMCRFAIYILLNILLMEKFEKDYQFMELVQ
jgi:hypothetical protein